MGISEIERICQGLITSGRNGDTPAAVIEKGTTEKQRVIIATLGTIASAASKAGMKPPAIIVIGDVVSVAGTIGDWFVKRD